MTEAPKVFISYSHGDEAYLEELLRFLKPLVLNEHIELWHDGRIGAGDDWYREIDAELKQAKLAVLLVTTRFLGSKFCKFQEVPVLLQRQRRGELALLPLLCEDCFWEDEPWLKRIQMRPGGKPLEQFSKAEQHTHLKNLAREVRDIARDGVKAPPTALKQWPREHFDLTRLPDAGSLLFGRRRELALLDRAWRECGADRTNVVVFTAGSGVGKSTLCRVWCEMLAEQDWVGAERAFGWSFYSQGTGRMTSADLFIDSALRWFGDPDPSKGSPWERGKRLAVYVRKRRCLLVLDGVEPLQSSAATTRGELQDPALKALLLELARENSGLCVLSTREPLVDLSECGPRAVLHHDLEQLSVQDGRAILRIAGIKGADEALETVVKDLGNHALAVSLLATFLADTPAQHIEGVRDVHAPADATSVRSHPRRVMQAWAKRLGSGPELELLHLLGLFDGSADRAAIEALRQAPTVPDLNQALQGIDLEPSLACLRQMRLLTKTSTHHPETLDCHPLVREHFGDELLTHAPKAWQAGHERLYIHYKDSTEDQPSTLLGLTPLYAAVVHGCAAGRHQEVFTEIYVRRISRSGEHFATKKLGAFGADLTAVSAFFAEPWHTLVPNMTATARAFLLNTAGFHLQTLGRLAEAIQPMQGGYKARVALSDWANAAISARNLSRLQLSLGDIGQAIALAKRSVVQADRGGHFAQRIINRTTHADALHQAGQRDEAQALFEEAETLQGTEKRDRQLLYSVGGYQYCTLLLDQGHARAVLERSSGSIAWVSSHGDLLSIALDQIALGRAYLQLGRFTDAEAALQQALDGLLHANTQDELPRALLARADLALAQQDFQRARINLRESFSLTVHMGTRLLEADTHLGFTRLHLYEHDTSAARESLRRARVIVEATGYHRRDAALAELTKLVE